MQAQQIYDNSSERLSENEANFGVAEIIREHTDEIKAELADITTAREAIEKNTMSEVVDRWARRSNAIGNITGFNSGQSLEETSKAYIKSAVSEKPKLKDIAEFAKPINDDELGDLKKFDIDKNNQFLDEVINEVKSESDAVFTVEPENRMLVEAKIQVDKYALENPITDNRFSADNSQFTLAI